MKVGRDLKSRKQLAAQFTLFNEIGIINQLSTTRFERALPHGLTLAQFSLLYHFSRLGYDKSPARLAAAFQVTKGAMTNTIGKLEGKGFVSVHPDPDDGRAKRVMLTEAGRRAHSDALKASIPVFEDVSEALSPGEVQKLLPVLQKLRIWLDENR